MLNLYHLKYFYDAATTKSLLGAAQINHVSSQAISQGIQSLESNLGVKLLAHKKNHFQLTVQGEKLKLEANKLLKTAESIRSVVEEENDRPGGNIEIAATGSVFHYLLNPALGKFAASNREVVVKTYHLPSAKVIDYLTRDQIAMGVLLYDSRIAPYDTVKLVEGEYALIAKQKQNLADASFFIKEEGPESWDFEKKYFKQFKKYPFIKGVLGSWESVLDYVDLGYGVGLLPDFIVERDPKGFVKPTLETSLSHYKIVIAFKARQHLPEVCAEFLKFLQEMA